MSAGDKTEDTSKRKSRFRPRIPRVRSGGLSAKEEFRKLRDTQNAYRYLCPHDGSEMDLEDVYPTDESGEIPEGAEPQRSLVCPTCAFTVPVTALAERLKQEAAPIKKSEKQLTIFGFAILGGFGILSIFTGNIATILGALVMSLMLFVKALFLRYRHWQITTGNLFLDKSPVKQWISQEFQKR